jgi:hypothetical protein
MVVVFCSSKNPDMRRYCNVLSELYQTRVETSVVFPLVKISATRDRTVLSFNVSINSFLLLIILKCRRIPLIQCVHDVVPHPGPKAIFITFVTSILMRYADKIVVFSVHQHASLPEYAKTKAIIGTLPLDSDLSENIPLVKKKQTAVFIGRGKAYQNGKWLAENVDKICDAQGLDEIIFVGKCCAGLTHVRQSKMRLVFEVSDRDLYALLRMAKYIILPYSSATQTGHTALAAVCGNELVVTNVGALPEAVHYTGGYILDDKCQLLSHSFFQNWNWIPKSKSLKSESKRFWLNLEVAKASL